MASKDPPAVGIDLGTTFSCVAVFENGKAKVIHNEEGNPITRSCVSFTEKGSLIGDAAYHRLTINPVNTVFDVKRLIGRPFNDPKVQEDVKLWPFTVEDIGGKPMIAVDTGGGTELLPPEQISGMVLSRMKEIAEGYLEEEVKQAVITVPAYFNESQRQATKDAARLAGLDAVRIINEPTAAALAYGYERWREEERKVVVYDLGGGTFDVSILSIQGGVFHVRATGGETHLGGADFDNNLAKYVSDWFIKKHQIEMEVPTDVQKNKIHRLRRACQLSKHKLSKSYKDDVIILDYLEEEDFHCAVFRHEFESCNQKLFDLTIEITKSVLSDAKMRASDVDEVILVGGSTRIPKIQQMLSSLFEGRKIVDNIDPDEAVALGAAVQAAALLNKPNPKIEDLLLIDVTPLSLGITSKDDLYVKIIDRNSHIPAIESVIRTTIKDKQTTVNLGIYQGERPMSKDNHFIREFYLEGIEPRPMGVPQIKVTFELDADCMLDATAIDLDTKQQQTVRVDYNQAKISEKELQRVLQTASRYKQEDTREKERIQMRSKLDTFATWIHYLVQHHAEQLELEGDAQQIMQYKAMGVLRWLESNTTNGKSDYIYELETLQKECKSLPEEYWVPGIIPGQNVKRKLLLQKASDEEEIGDID